MKQEVDCLKCGRNWPDKATDRNEHIKKFLGYALADYSCDGCGEALPTGVPVICVSVWTELGGIPYFTWETGYATPMSEQELDAYERLNGTKELDGRKNR